MQGLLELANVPYVGCGVLASAVGMDKAMMKVVFAAHGLPQVDLRGGAARRVGRDRAGVRAALLAAPAAAAVRQAGQPRLERRHLQGHRRRRARRGARARGRASIARSWSRPACRTRARSSAPCSATTRPRRRSPARSCPSREFYDYEAKYLDEGSKTVDPGRPAPAQTRATCSGCRIDGLPRHRRRRAGARRLPARRATTGDVYVNEMNTHARASPPSACTASCGRRAGVTYPALIDRLIALAIERHAAKQQLRTSVL